MPKWTIHVWIHQDAMTLRIILLLASFVALSNSTSDLDDFLKKLEEDYKKYGKDKVLEDLELQWQDYMKKYGKEYTPEEKEMRLAQLHKHQKIVDEHNKLHEQGKVSYKMKLNHLSDLTEAERVAINGYKKSNSSKHKNRFTKFTYDKNAKVPDSIDWREKGYVGPVKNQGACGSCYAFSAVGALEAYYKRESGKLVSISEQNIIDCSWEYGNGGCKGGAQSAVYSYVQDHGVTITEKYPYTANASHDCKKVTDPLIYDYGRVGITPKDEDALKHAVATVGPVSVSIYASGKGLHLYHSGVYSDPTCAGNNVNHGVLAVGYGVDPEHGDYWIIKNSWGPHWGFNGYVLIARNKNNMCDIGQVGNWPRSKKEDPQQ